MESIYSSCTLCFDQIPNLQNCFTTTNNGRGFSDRQTPAAKALSRSIFKKSRHIGLESISYLVYGPGYVEGENVEKDGGQPQVVVQQADVILWDERKTVKKTPFS